MPPASRPARPLPVRSYPSRFPSDLALIDLAFVRSIAHLAAPCIAERIMDLPLEPRLRIGIQTIHRRTEPAVGPWLPTIDEMHALVSQIDCCGYDSIWVADHISYPAAILDPLLQLAQAAMVSRRLLLGVGVYLLPLRHPVP